MYRTLIVKALPEASSADLEDLYRVIATHKAFASMRYAIGDNIQDAKLLVFDEQGNLSASQG